MESIETIEKSIKVLEDMASQEDTDLKLEVIRVAISVLKKQIPSKPIIKNWSPALCPACHEELSESLGDGYYKHYSNTTICKCGQRLDWKNEN